MARPDGALKATTGFALGAGLDLDLDLEDLAELDLEDADLDLELHLPHKLLIKDRLRLILRFRLHLMGIDFTIRLASLLQ